MKLKLIYSLLLFSFIVVAYADEISASTQTANEELPQAGNFILPSSQQPGSFISFGQNIINKDQIQFSLAPDNFVGKNKNMIDVVPAVLYGLTDDFSVYFGMPIAASYQDNQDHSSGVEDTFLQFEYAFYASQTSDHTNQATLVSNVTFPTGSSTIQPNTGIGSPSFFIGATFNRSYVKWFMFTSYGTVITTENYATRYGNQLLYQAGLGRNLFDIDTRWIFAWLVEADGYYVQKNKIDGVIDGNSGGNIVYVTPSIWASSKHFIFQFGAGAPVIQHLYGSQGNNHYLLQLSLSWTLG